MVWGALGVLLYVAHAAFVPLALALLFGLVLSAPVEALHKIRVPRSLSAALILLLALSALGGIVALMRTPTQEWFAKAPQTMTTIKQKVSPIAKFMNHVDALRKNTGDLGAESHAAPAAAVAAPAVATQSAPALILDVGPPVIAGVLAFVIATLFLLTGGPPMMARMTAAFVDNLKASYVLNIIDKVRSEVGHSFYVPFVEKYLVGRRDLTSLRTVIIPNHAPATTSYAGYFRLRRYTPVRDSAGRWPIARLPPARALPDYQPLPFEPPREEPPCRT